MGQQLDVAALGREAAQKVVNETHVLDLCAYCDTALDLVNIQDLDRALGRDPTDAETDVFTDAFEGVIEEAIR